MERDADIYGCPVENGLSSSKGRASDKSAGKFVGHAQIKRHIKSRISPIGIAISKGIDAGGIGGVGKGNIQHP